MRSALYPTSLSDKTPHEEMAPSPGAAFRPQMHAIFLETGCNDEYAMSLLSVTDDLAAGQAWVDKMNETYRSLQKKRQTLVLATLAWRQINPMPAFIEPTLLQVPTPPTDRPATPEEREEKHRINNENFLRNLASRDPQRQWSRQEAAFSKEWLAGNLSQEEAEMDQTFNEKFWSIQPVAWHAP